MRTREPLYDVFLSYSAADAVIARSVVKSLTASGLQVFELSRAEVGRDVQKTIVQAIAESAALIAIVTPESSRNPNVAVEVGAAWAWTKPIYVLATDEVHAPFGAVLGAARVYRLSDIDDVILEIKRSRRPLSAPDRDALIDAFQALGVSVDVLISQPAMITRLAELFNADRGGRVAGEQLVQELLRLRKQGKLPRRRRRAI